MKGIKLHPDYQDTYFNDIRYKRIISYATEPWTDNQRA